MGGEDEFEDRGGCLVYLFLPCWPAALSFTVLALVTGEHCLYGLALACASHFPMVELAPQLFGWYVEFLFSRDRRQMLKGLKDRTFTYYHVDP